MVDFNNSVRIRTQDSAVIIATLCDQVEQLTRQLAYTGRQLEERENEIDKLRAMLKRVDSHMESMEEMHDV